MKNLEINLKKDKKKSRPPTFQFQIDDEITKNLDRLWKEFRDEHPTKSDLIRFLINEAYKQNIL